MIPYYLFFLFFGFGALLDNVKQDDKIVPQMKNFFLITGFFIILFFVGFRYKIGSDWAVYLRAYEECLPLGELFSGDNLSFASDFTEPGYKILVSLFNTIGLNFFLFVFSITLFNTFSLYYFLTKSEFRNKFVFISIILILTVFTEFDILRQSLAFHILLFAFAGPRIKVLKLFALTALAISFHYTSIIFILFYFFQKLRLTHKGCIIIAAVYFISLFVTLPIITSILKMIEPFASGVLLAILVKGQTLISGFEFSRNISFTSLLNLMFLILLTVNIKKLKLSYNEEVLLKMFVFYILLNALFKEVQEVADRFSYYFNFGIAFMFSLLTDMVRIRERKLLIMWVPCIFIIMRLTLHFRQEAIVYGQTPYRNYLFVSESDEAVILQRYDIMMNLKTQENERKKD